MELKEIQGLISKIEPVVAKYKANTFLRIVNKSAAYFGAWLLYILGVACIAFIFIMDTVYPFHVMSKIADSTAVIAAIGSKSETQTFVFAIKALVVGLGLFLIYIGRLQTKLAQQKTAFAETASELQQTLDVLQKEEKELLKDTLESKGLADDGVWKELDAKPLP